MLTDEQMIAHGFWVFGYGSLLWQPEFEAEETILARATGFTRSFCMWSIHHRGTEENPGLVLALDKGQGTCDGMGFFIPPERAAETLAALRERELISSAYYEAFAPLDLADGRKVEALVYVIAQDHVQYCTLTLEKQAQVIAQAVGGRGPNPEYLYRTKEKLDELGISDADIDWLTARVQTLTQ